jgi:hypothetical protein
MSGECSGGLSNHVSTGWSYGPTVALRARDYLSGGTALWKHHLPIAPDILTSLRGRSCV